MTEPVINSSPCSSPECRHNPNLIFYCQPGSATCFPFCWRRYTPLQPFGFCPAGVMGWDVEEMPSACPSLLVLSIPLITQASDTYFLFQIPASLKGCKVLPSTCLPQSLFLPWNSAPIEESHVYDHHAVPKKCCHHHSLNSIAAAFLNSSARHHCPGIQLSPHRWGTQFLLSPPSASPFST